MLAKDYKWKYYYNKCAKGANNKVKENSGNKGSKVIKEKRSI
jgi:hypothetical protein